MSFHPATKVAFFDSSAAEDADSNNSSVASISVGCVPCLDASQQAVPSQHSAASSAGVQQLEACSQDGTSCLATLDSDGVSPKGVCVCMCDSRHGTAEWLAGSPRRRYGHLLADAIWVDPGTATACAECSIKSEACGGFRPNLLLSACHVPATSRIWVCCVEKACAGAGWQQQQHHQPCQHFWGC